MKRLVLCLMLLASQADARVLFVYGWMNTSTVSSNGVEVDESRTFNAQRVHQEQQILDDFGAAYKPMPASALTTEMVRTGKVTYKDGSTEQFDGVIFSEWLGSQTRILFQASNASNSPKWSPDSVSVAAYTGTDGTKGPRVPWLILASNTWEIGAFTDPFITAAHDSFGTSSAGMQTDGGKVSYAPGNPTLRVYPNVFRTGYPNGGDAVGGVREVLIQSQAGGAYVNRQQPPAFTGLAPNAQWPDSLPFQANTPDTMIVWDLQMNRPDMPGAKTITCCYYAGTGTSPDSLLSANGGNIHMCGEGDPQVVTFAFAHFDSLTGHKLFPPATLRPIRIAFAVSKGFAYSSRWGRNGVFPGDTATFFASLDSLNKWGIPYTFYGNTDSAWAWNAAVARLKANNLAHFGPQVWTGVSDTSAATAASTGFTPTWQRPIDPLGRWRNRAAIGDDSGVGADTTTKTLVRATFWKADSIFGRPRVSRVLYPAADDWSPKNCRASSGRTQMDSTLYALSQDGITGIIFNRQWDECYAGTRAGLAVTNPRGYDQPAEGRYAFQVPGASGLKTFYMNMLGHFGGSPEGGDRQASVWADSAVAGAYIIGHISQDIYRAWACMLYDWNVDHDVFQRDDPSGAVTPPNLFAGWVGVSVPAQDLDVKSWWKHAHIVSLYASDLSGNPANPARTGLWVMRYVFNGAQQINLANGRELIHVGYPDDIRP